ncbi:hypothetical protein MMC13_001172 [Lambiella insularis]|nr:hypothetical protein [Lambiella insularis]
MELGGMKWLYAHAYYTEEEFWSMYDRKWYEALRVKWSATTLLSVYEKIKVDVDAEEKALEGVFKAVLRSEYIIPNTK